MSQLIVSAQDPSQSEPAFRAQLIHFLLDLSAAHTPRTILLEIVKTWRLARIHTTEPLQVSIPIATGASAELKAPVGDEPIAFFRERAQGVFMAKRLTTFTTVSPSFLALATKNGLVFRIQEEIEGLFFVHLYFTTTSVVLASPSFYIEKLCGLEQNAFCNFSTVDETNVCIPLPKPCFVLKLPSHVVEEREEAIAIFDRMTNTNTQTTLTADEAKLVLIPELAAFLVECEKSFGFMSRAIPDATRAIVRKNALCYLYPQPTIASLYLHPAIQTFDPNTTFVHNGALKIGKFNMSNMTFPEPDRKLVIFEVEQFISPHYYFHIGYDAKERCFRVLGVVNAQFERVDKGKGTELKISVQVMSGERATYRLNSKELKLDAFLVANDEKRHADLKFKSNETIWFRQQDNISPFKYDRSKFPKEKAAIMDAILQKQSLSVEQRETLVNMSDEELKGIEDFIIATIFNNRAPVVTLSRIRLETLIFHNIHRQLLIATNKERYKAVAEVVTALDEIVTL